MKMCSISGCDRLAVERGWCHRHYMRWWEQGRVTLLPTPSPEERFWGKVARGDSDECWLWSGALNEHGYGLLWLNGRQVRAHRYAYELLVGPIPKRLTLDHLCRNRSCVNPAHLDPATLRENILRGVGITAQAARKTHCKNGHPFDETNTIYERAGRRCRTCQNRLVREHRARKREVQPSVQRGTAHDGRGR